MEFDNIYKVYSGKEDRLLYVSDGSILIYDKLDLNYFKIAYDNIYLRYCYFEIKSDDSTFLHDSGSYNYALLKVKRRSRNYESIKNQFITIKWPICEFLMVFR